MRSRLSAFLLSAALLLAQAVALVHGVHHAGGPARPPGVAAAAGSHAHGSADRLAGSHDTPVCRLIDQLAHADALPCLPVLLLPLLPAATVLVVPALVLPAPDRPHALPRGPPASR